MNGLSLFTENYMSSLMFVKCYSVRSGL